MISSDSPAESVSSATMGVAILRVLLVLVGVGCLVEVWHANRLTEEYRLHYPQFTPWLWNLYLTYEMSCVVAMFGMWNWRKWGLFVLTGMAVAMLFTEFYAMGFTFMSLRIPLVLSAVWFVSRPWWTRFQ